MKKIYLIKIACCALIFVLFSSSVFAQKGLDKGKEFVAKAVATTDASKRSEWLTKAQEAFREAGIVNQGNLIVGDAFLEKGDLKTAELYYAKLDKATKADALHRLADAYVNAAFTDEKTQAKSLKDAMKFYVKANAAKEGAAGIGDRFYELGEASYDKAVDYYLQGDLSKAEKIGDELAAKGGESEIKAADIYKKIKTYDAYSKAGDIYFSRKEYIKASEAYLTGGVTQGIKKYAEYLFSQNKFEDGSDLFVKLAEIYHKKEQDDELMRLGAECEAKGNYGLAGRIYEQAADYNKAQKAFAYDKVVKMDFDSARIYFIGMGDNATAKFINDNMKYLTPIKASVENFDDLMKNQPYVSTITDSLTGEVKPVKAEKKVLDDYYNGAKGQIADNCYAIATNYAKLTNAEIKALIKIRALRYSAVRNILDKQTLAVKLQKSQVTLKEAFLQQ
jgi:tetratricopeptide (TPR) repeat protein